MSGGDSGGEHGEYGIAVQGGEAFVGGVRSHDLEGEEEEFRTWKTRLRAETLLFPHLAGGLSRERRHILPQYGSKEEWSQA